MRDFPYLIKALLFISCLFCVAVILFDIGIIPPVFGYSENAEAINKAILNISYSYIAGFIFAILTIYIPNRIEIRKSLNKVQNSITAILKELSWCEGALSFIDTDNQLNGISNNAAIDPNAFSTSTKQEYITVSLIDSNEDAELSNIDIDENTWYTNSAYYGINGEIIDNRVEYINVVSDVYEITSRIKSIITDIKVSSHYKGLPSKLINLLDSIYSDTLFHEAKYLHDAVNNKLIVAENFTYNHSELPHYINNLKRFVSNNTVCAKVNFTKLKDADYRKYIAYLDKQKEHGDMYRKIQGIERIYDGKIRI